MIEKESVFPTKTIVKNASESVSADDGKLVT